MKCLEGAGQFTTQPAKADNHRQRPPEVISPCLPVLVADRLPRKPYCSNNLDTGLHVRPQNIALRFSELQINPPAHQAWLTFDVDRRHAAFAWEKALLPQPAWTTVNPTNGHAHLTWALEAPVCKTQAGRDSPLRYLSAIQAGFQKALGADPNYNDLLTHNPINSRWRVLVGEQRLWKLEDLAGWVDLPRDGNELVLSGLGRNCTIFDSLRYWAYEAVRRHRQLRNVAHWEAEVFAKAVEFNARFPIPLEQREVAATAQSVGKWVWRQDPAAAAAFCARQSAKGKQGAIKSSEKRRAQSAGTRADAIRMKDSGRSLKEIAQQLGMSKSGIKKWVDQGRALRPKSDNSPDARVKEAVREAFVESAASEKSVHAGSQVYAQQVAAGCSSPAEETAKTGGGR